ncbi:FUSC family protein [Actinomycetospora endophytica]|uniref:FUSC family protein n=1 Tax=Actinomycetospora endophytica TaxID=2291215 RepID=A0ABS8PB46_9PSEU|nr:FUSC family protein [Actinomycetospora endophytica]MCD2195501.1 FUSC family protein [Actinomycetospora endophytica]
MTVTSTERRQGSRPVERNDHAQVVIHGGTPGERGTVARISWRDRLLASDPGNVRIALATRAALSLAVALGVAALLANGLGLQGIAAMIVLVLGAVLTMMTTFTASDPTTGGRAITQLCLPVALLAGITLSTLVDKHRVLSLSLFVVVMFVVVWVRRFGPRAFACGMVVWMGYFMALFLQLSFAQLPVVLLAVASSTVLLLIIGLVVAPQRPARRTRRMVDAFAARVRIAAAEHRDAEARSPWQRWTGRIGTADRALLRVNEVAVLLDGQLAVPHAVADPRHAPQARAAILRTESALARLLDTTPDEVVPADVDAVERALDQLRGVLADDRAGTDDPRDATGEAGEAGVAGPAFTPAAELFAGFLPGSAVTVGPMVAPEGAAKLLLTTRQALQIALAGGLSIALGDALSGQRWYWAVLACFLAFTGTATAAETIRKGMQRTVGTVVGVVVALVVVPLLGHSTVISLVVILLAIFVGFYLFRVSYTCLAFAITIMIAELYELLGTYSEGLLALRVGETALGAVIGGVVAVSFLPTSATCALEAARARLAEELRAATVDVAAVLHGRGATAGEDGGPVDLHARVRSLDFAIHQLALIGVPLSLRTAPGSGARKDAVSGRLSAWVRCAARVRAVIHAVEDSRSHRHEAVQGAMTAVGGLVDALAEGRSPGRHADRPDTDPDSPETLLAELSSLHGALIALHEIDPTAPIPEDASASEAAVAADPAATTCTAVRGRVTEGGGRGLDAVVTAVDPHGRQLGRVRTDAGAGGSFAVAVGAGTGPWLVVVAAAGFAPHAGRASAGPEHHVVLEPARQTATIPL